MLLSPETNTPPSPVEKEALADIANVYNYQAFVETEKAGYIIRQWLASNLYDRIRFAFVQLSSVCFTNSLLVLAVRDRF